MVYISHIEEFRQLKFGRKFRSGFWRNMAVEHGEKPMYRSIGIILIALFLSSAGPSGFSQLRNLSPYDYDRINAEHTFFVLKDANTASFGWACEWTHMTANAYPEKHGIFLWHFKDGSKAYSHHEEYIGDTGKLTAYLPKDESPNLEGSKREKIQPMTRTNYPVKVELWVGEAPDNAELKLEELVDAACFDAQDIEFGRTYHFSECRQASKSGRARSLIARAAK
jgi:hypothetical protein